MTANVSADVLVVGAGPGGLTAAAVAAEHGLRTVVLDDNLSPGGQIWRDGLGSHKRHRDPARQRALRRFEASGATLLSSHRVFDVSPKHSLLHAVHEGEAGSTVTSFAYKHLILASGARERFLPFPGWTLPGVFGAGGLQALAQSGFNVAGKRIVIAGTGPLLLAVAAHLKSMGAKIVCVAEQASTSSLLRMVPLLLTRPGKLFQGLQYRAKLAGIPYRTHTWPLEASPNAFNGLRGVRLTNGKRTWVEPCELLACGFHLVPNNELAALLGCKIENSFVKVDAQQRTSVPNVFSIGETTGIAGVDAAVVQGHIAALACAERDSKSLQRHAQRHRSFGRTLDRAFAIRSEVLAAATPDTIVCRCEDVALGRIQAYSGWTEAKLQSRCGMGPCQARICGPAVETLLGWKPSSVRPPIFPIPLAALCPSPDSIDTNPLNVSKETV